MDALLTIGYVFDLREKYRAAGYSEEDTAEFDTEDSVAELVASLERLGHKVDKVGGGKELAARLVAGASWDIVLSMAEGVAGRGREAQVPALLDMFNQPYVFSDALTMGVALDKAVAKRLVRQAGIPTADFTVVDDDSTDLQAWRHYPAFVKPVAEGTSKGCDLESRVHDLDELRMVSSRLRKRFRQPVIVEPYLDGEEFTVGVIGNGRSAHVLGVARIFMMEGADPDIFTLRNKERQDELCRFEVAADPDARQLEVLALRVYHALGCLDCCRIDFRCDSRGRPYFLEANPIPGLHPTNSDLPVLADMHGIRYDELIQRIVSAAMTRYTGVCDE